VQAIVTMKGPKGKGTARNTRETLKPVDDRLVFVFCLDSTLTFYFIVLGLR
jgi:hypothetical protein